MTPDELALHPGNRPILVEGGPGSGKTTVLVRRLLHLLDTGVSPERILALTFSRKAAAEIRARIEQARRRSFGRLWITTFHSFGHTLIQRYAVDAGVPRSFRLLTGFKEWVLTRDVLSAVELHSALSSARRHRGLTSEVANAVAQLKQRRVSPETLESAAEGSDDEALLFDLARVYRRYELELHSRRHFDYRDLINRALDLLQQTPRVREQVQGWFDHVLLDEVQDLDPVQARFVRALLHGSPLATRTMAFGDRHQSIYRFRGAAPGEAMPLLIEAMPDPIRVRLERNLRSSESIAAIGRRLLERPAKSGDGPGVNVRACATSLAEASAIAREIKRLHGQARQRTPGALLWRDMAVLCRSVRRDARPIENELTRLGIPYRVHGNSSFYRNPAVAFLVNLILALVDDEDDAPLRRVMASPVPGLPGLPLARFLDRVSRRGRHAGRYLWFLRRLMHQEDPQRFPLWNPPETAETEGELEKARAPYFYELMSVDEKQAFHAFHERLLLLQRRARRAETALPSLVAAIAAWSGLTDWILRLDAQEPREAARHAANVSKLQFMVQDYVEIVAAGRMEAPGLEELAGHLRELLEHFASESELEPPNEEQFDPEDAVAIMTVHQAKGLEFDVVFVPHLAAGHFPAPPRPNLVLSEAVEVALRRARPDQALPATTDPLVHADDERRLFYVAATRARERLFLTWARRHDGDDEDSAPSSLLLAALGASELEFWRLVQQAGLTPKAALAQLARRSRDPEVCFVDDEAVADALDEVMTKEELELSLRRGLARGGESQAIVEKVLQRFPALDRTFVTSSEPFPREPSVPLRLGEHDLQLSASRLADHRDCPRKFFYAKLLHLEPPSGGAARLGTLVHEVLRAFHEAHPDREEVGSAGDRLANELRERLECELAKNRDGFASAFAFQRARAQARAMVEPYLRMLPQEPTRFVAGREVELHFRAVGARLVALIDRIGTDTPSVEGSTDALVADYKTVRSTNPRGLTLRKWIEEGQEIQLVTYYKAFLEHFGRAPGYLGKVFLRHTSEWRPGTLQVLLRVTDQEPAKADPFRGRDGRKWTDRAWISPAALDEAWRGIEGRIAAILDPTVARFQITPSAPVCRGCIYGVVCGKEDLLDADG